MKSEKKCSFPLCDEKPWQDKTDNMPAVPGEDPDGLPTPDVDSDDVPATPGEGPDGFPMPELPPDSSDLPTDSIDPRLLSLAMALYRGRHGKRHMISMLRCGAARFFRPWINHFWERRRFPND